jgi:hypothetical protein
LPSSISKRGAPNLKENRRNERVALPSMAIADILLIGWEVISTILTISWTFLNTLFEALQVIYIEHHNNSNSTADDS